jgi:hypothetical protein
LLLLLSYWELLAAACSKCCALIDTGMWYCCGCRSCLLLWRYWSLLPAAWHCSWCCTAVDACRRSCPSTRAFGPPVLHIVKHTRGQTSYDSAKHGFHEDSLHPDSVKRLVRSYLNRRREDNEIVIFAYT